MSPRPSLVATPVFIGMVGLTISLAPLSTGDETKTDTSEIDSSHLPVTEEEARGRARMLHETIHGALQVMHRDFFAGEEDLNLPSQSLEDVFREMARQFQIEIRWLGINATKDVDHEPQDAFEEKVAEAILNGAAEFASVERGRYRHVGAIRIQNECHNCHVPNRTSLEDRFAGLAITIPLRPAAD